MDKITLLQINKKITIEIIFLIFFTIFLLCGCSGKPSDKEIENLFIAEYPFRSIVEVKNFRKTNAFSPNDKTYIADISYDIVFKRTIKDGDDDIHPFLALSAFAKFGFEIKAGGVRHCTDKIKLIKKEKGWSIDIDERNK